VVGPTNGRGPDARSILTCLPTWFADAAAVDDYVAAADRGPCWVARDGRDSVGFLALTQDFPASAEIIAMGVLPAYRGRGIGRSLVEAVTSWAITSGVRVLYVKTLGPSDPDPGYAETRAFYEAVGFVPIEENSSMWGPASPCLLSVKPINAD
jgi:GNAT superfamily N-acetyltransferase